MSPAPFEKLLDTIASLQRAKIPYSLAVTRDDAITILATVPGQRWEIDVFRNGSVDLDVFQSEGGIQSEERLTELVARFAD